LAAAEEEEEEEKEEEEKKKKEEKEEEQEEHGEENIRLLAAIEQRDEAKRRGLVEDARKKSWRPKLKAPRRGWRTSSLEALCS